MEEFHSYAVWLEENTNHIHVNTGINRPGSSESPQGKTKAAENQMMILTHWEPFACAKSGRK